MTKTEIKACLFDVFGTLVDWRCGIANIAADFFAQKHIDFDPFEFALMWRGEYQPAMEKIRSGGRGYIALDVLHRENLDRVLDRVDFDEQFSEQERDEFNHAWEKLPRWPDVLPGLARLKQKTIIAPCSNGSIALMTRLAKFSGLPWDCILGADIARDYKPNLSVYQACCAVLQLEPENVVMVAAHNDDLDAARQAGLQTAFFLRPGEYGPEQKSDLKAHSDWDFIASDLEELAGLIGC